MTISTTSSQTVAQGNGATTVFSFSFVVDSASSLSVIYTDTNGIQTLLSPSQYTVFLNSPSSTSLHSIGGTITYPTVGSPIANGTSLTISRTLPLTQTTSISNQGDFYPTVVEQALDNLCQEIQQVSARTGQLRGTWQTGIAYNYGDIVQDGINGLNTLNYYTCIIANTSGTWSTDLGAGDWSIGFNTQAVSGYATAAATSASAAAASATSASTSASSASTSAANSLASANSASTSATTASVAASNASTSATNAATSAAAAAGSATSANTSANNAATSATTANTQAGIATTAASSASTFASSASASANSAAASASVAAGSLIGTSTTSNTIGTGTKTFATSTTLAIPATGGNFVIVSSSASPANYFHGQVTSYSGGSLVINVLDVGGTGTFASWNIVTSSPQGPAGGGSGTVNSGTANQMAYYAGTGTALSGNANVTVSTGALTLGVAGTAQGSLVLSGLTSGTTTVAAPAIGTGTMTLQAGSDTIVGRATTDTFTNKTLTSSTNVLGGVTITVGSDATGDIHYRNVSGVFTRLAIGGANTVLHGGTIPSYSAVVEGDLGLTDLTTANVTSTAHGFAPKSPADATQFLNGATTPGYAQVKDSDLSTSDITTNNVSTSKHGFAPKGNGVATNYLDGTGAYSAALPPTTLAAVGSYAMFYTTSDISTGSTVAGSSLKYSAMGLAGGVWSGKTSGTSPAGTWRAMGDASLGGGAYTASVTLFVRTV